MSNDSVELCCVAESGIDHSQRGDLIHLLLLFDEGDAVTFDGPGNAVFVVVCPDELHELVLLLDHEHLLHILDGDRLVGPFRGTGYFRADRVSELIDEEVIMLQGHVLSLLQDVAVGASHKIVFEGDRHFNVDIVLQVFLR